ncbi:MAG: hypothetical protein AVDCRST_MAG37-3627 [uncultured Rubrobacteraceae bacterium]|uniref:Uncharacterized protein n=1 Tax=uncultured Rubrobacteraceae bacterium TaxID=349277 RepID=A0A6J4R4Q6_9ACTN|nr:MAG: hypothetical protein AVDCRST_MAG37-3627 [uncultured Rubrobacteraceae bacterium]
MSGLLLHRPYCRATFSLVSAQALTYDQGPSPLLMDARRIV